MPQTVTAVGRILPPALLFLLLCACSTMPTDSRLVHDVYFELQDASPQAQQALVAACYDKLAGIDGVTFLVAGTRDAELQREVNDTVYHVSLHVYFKDRAAHDAYQAAPAHLEFIAMNKPNWRSVRVFDSTIAPR